MIEVSKKSIEMLHKLDNVVRYSTWATRFDEPVTTHSYYVALFTMMICYQLNVPPSLKLAAIEMALVHDTPELEVNDITYNAKQLMPEIDSVLETYEKMFIGQHFPETYDFLFGDSVAQMIVQDIVKLADIISVYQYVVREVKSGNSYFDGIPESTIERIEKVKSSLESRGLKCQKITI